MLAAPFWAIPAPFCVGSCSLLCRKLLPFVSEAAPFCVGSCSLLCRKLLPFVSEAAPFCVGSCSLLCRKLLPFVSEAAPFRAQPLPLHRVEREPLVAPFAVSPPFFLQPPGCDYCDQRERRAPPFRRGVGFPFRHRLEHPPRTPSQQIRHQAREFEVDFFQQRLQAVVDLHPDARQLVLARCGRCRR